MSHEVQNLFNCLGEDMQYRRLQVLQIEYVSIFEKYP